MFCLKCGANLPDGSSFCNVCGADLRSNTASQPAAPQQPVQNYQPQQPQQYYQGGQPPIPPNQPYQTPAYQPIMAAPGKNYAVPIICAVAGAAIIALVIVLIIVLGGNKEGSSSNGSNGEIGGNISSGIGNNSSSGISGSSQFSDLSFSVDGKQLSNVKVYYCYGDIENGIEGDIIVFLGQRNDMKFGITVNLVDGRAKPNNTYYQSDFGQNMMIQAIYLDTGSGEQGYAGISGRDSNAGARITLGNISRSNIAEVSVHAPISFDQGNLTMSAKGTAHYKSYDEVQQILVEYLKS